MNSLLQFRVSVFLASFDGVSESLLAIKLPYLPENTTELQVRQMLGWKKPETSNSVVSSAMDKYISVRLLTVSRMKGGGSVCVGSVSTLLVSPVESSRGLCLDLLEQP